ncbi:hypothetical protein ED312_13250 [Sinomicrobium pectinilyticum]|uniref:Outer membrane protein beta-barrel domain-containing protein n=1 Tax=Sinomicrobium pectinilyticum TaxID=1084421 RepID=A0A3N0EAV0_SINP1|nr:DUF6048 family protein [Sinomicrobium pectinilyticum]RNL84940.1 hypothetical protein ED312_13250 [Sinomicrobium pectinilyticum]
MLKYIISIVFFSLCSFAGIAQENDNEEKPKDSVVYKEKYGLRVGIDLGKPIRSFASDNYSGLELTGDFRISKNLYIAAELGTEEKTSKENLYTFSTSGSYLRAGVDYNLYENWYGMENLIFAGARLGVTTFSQTLDEYYIYTTNPYWGENGIPGTDENILGEYSGLSAQWLEVLFGMKVELFNNLYLGGTVRLGYLLNDTPPDTFTNLWIPGFQKVTNGSKFGLTFNYTVSYLIPVFKKTKKGALNKTEEGTIIIEE